MGSVDFKNTNMVRMSKKREMLFNFGSQNMQRHMKLIFLTRERTQERKNKIGENTSQNEDKTGNRVTKGSAKCRPIVLWFGLVLFCL